MEGLFLRVWTQCKGIENANRKQRALENSVKGRVDIQIIRHWKERGG